MEEWRDIPGWEGLYQASSLGQIKSLSRAGSHVHRGSLRHFFVTEKILHGTKTPKGYCQIVLSADGRKEKRFRHVFVARTFLGNRPVGLHVCHNDGNANNDCPANLRYDTPAGNSADMLRHGSACRGERRPQSKMTADAVRWARAQRIARAMTITSMAGQLGVTVASLADAISGRTWKHVR